jgi:hypothetical protein
MLAHVVINYDLKAEVEGVRPRDSASGVSITPFNSTAKVQFQKRTDFYASAEKTERRPVVCYGTIQFSKRLAAEVRRLCRYKHV